jgi:FKBP-type peptidyl-prolyl cis-trans isomerase
MAKSKLWLLALGLVLISVAVLVFGLNKNKPVAMLPTATPSLTALPNATIQPAMSELQIQDEVVGTGAEAVAGKLITVNYLGTLLDGTKFDSSYDRRVPFQFTLGAGEVIQGWDQGFAGMKVGGKRKLTIPPELGYGATAMGGIPANSTLVFEVELLKVE